MACETGLRLQEQFEMAIAARLEVESRVRTQHGAELRLAKTTEAAALADRAMHVSGCRHCWMAPPPFTGRYYRNL